LSELTDGLLCELTPHHTSLSLPSLRLDNFSLELMEKASSTRKGVPDFCPGGWHPALARCHQTRTSPRGSPQGDGTGPAWWLERRQLYFMLGLPDRDDRRCREASAHLAQAIEKLYQSLRALNGPSGWNCP
jgi:hypothetical protein